MWPLQPLQLQPLQETQLQPPVGPSVDSLYHPGFTTTNLCCRFPIFETSATALCGTTGSSFTCKTLDNGCERPSCGWFTCNKNAIFPIYRWIDHDFPVTKVVDFPRCPSQVGPEPSSPTRCPRPRWPHPAAKSAGAWPRPGQWRPRPWFNGDITREHKGIHRLYNKLLTR